MKADLHVHSNYSEDGQSTPEQILEYAEKFGIGCVAITDHNSMKAFFDIKDNGKIIIIPGTEVSSKEGHILGLGIDKEITAGLSIEDTIDEIHNAGGYAFVAHPYRWWSGIGEENTLKYNFDGIESLNARSTQSSNKQSNKLALKIGKPIVAGSDAHDPKNIGAGYLFLPDGLTTWQEVIKCIMEEKLEARSESRGLISSLKYGFKSITEWTLRGFKKM